MVYPEITELPEAPNRGTDTSTEFSNKTDALLGALDGFVTDVNAAGEYIEETATEVESNAAAAAASETAAAGYANYKGDWTISTNVLTGESYSYDGGTWTAKRDSVGQTPVAGTYWLKGVGTAAYEDVVTGFFDTTEGSVLKVGSGGWLGGMLNTASYGDDLSLLNVGTLSAVGVDTANKPSFAVSNLAGVVYSSERGKILLASYPASEQGNVYTYNSGSGTWHRQFGSNNVSTSTEITAGTSDETVVTPLGLAGSEYNPDNRVYESSAQTISSGGSIVLSHGFGVEPVGISLIIQCTTAEEGYTVGERVMISSNTTTTAFNRSVSLKVDSTNIAIKFPSTSAVFSVANFSDGSVQALTNSSWDLYIKAWY